ncbi:MAG TPA: hypothetical protein VF483_09215 [Gemmatimonadaceae bacterium]
MRIPEVARAVFSALIVGSLAFYVDLRNDEVQAAALVLVVGSGIIGVAWPKWSWAAGVTSGACIFGGYGLFHVVGIATPQPAQPNLYGALIAIVPAVIGALLGAGLRAVLRTGDATRS